ncbi:M20 family metallopeptidase [Microbacterium gorillae]|uniref:M20 family metallopeptidase n=1 Tax=Microbacterium gorillae TaxID=1231063 RepID=UPI00058DBD17|nr:M20/M25/M40 family metallo-hydrolase [Microbacterium gorillae]
MSTTVTAEDTVAADRESRVLARIDPEAIASLTERLIEAASENPGGVEEPAVSVLAAALRAAGATVELDEVLPGRSNLVARFGPRDGAGGVLFLGHSDVVPAGAGWSADPFIPRRGDGTIIGRGATDMKGGLAAVVAATAAVHAEAPDLPITVLCTVDEEADALGAQHHITHRPATRHALCIVAEPTALTTITGCRGAANFRVEIRGASAHAGRPSDGASAILAATDLIATIEQDSRRLDGLAHPVLGSGSWNVGTIVGGHGTSIVPDRCVVGIDRRTLPGEEPTLVLTELLGRTAELIRAQDRPGAERITVDGVVEMTMPGFMTDPASAEVARVRAAVREVGGAGDVDVWTASCEGGFIARHHDVPTVVLGPGDLPGQAHQPDESVSISELAQAARAYALIVLRTIPEPSPATTADL